MLGFMAAAVLLFLYEYARIHRYGGQREVAAFIVSMGVAVAFGLAMIMELPVPKPTDLIQSVFQPLGEMIVPLR